MSELQDAPILADNGRPWPSAKAAQAEGIAKANRDPETFGTMEYEGGYAVATYRYIMVQRDRKMAEKAALDAENARNRKMRFFKVMIHPRHSDNDPENILLSVSNWALVVTRGKECILPEPHFNDLREAEMEDLSPAINDPMLSRQPERSIKVGANMIQRFPFTLIGEASETEFQEFMARMRQGATAAQKSQQLQSLGS
jgi:hypothetical protein